MLNTTSSSQVFTGNEVFAANNVFVADEVGGIEDSNESIGKCGKLLKLRKTSKGQKLSKSQKLAKSKKPSKSRNSPNFDTKNSEPSFLTPKARATFNHLRLTFTKALILWHFDLKCYIWIKTDASGNAIGGVLSQLASGTRPDRVITKTDVGQWHPIAFFSRKMIPAETRYKTYDSEVLAIVKAFKTWRHYLKGCKHRVLVLTDYNNIRCFMDIKKSELQTSLLGPRALSILFSNQLSPGHGKCSCRCFVKVFPEKPRWEN